MNYESYTETLFHIQKKHIDDSILTLKMFTNNTRKIGTKLSPMSWYEHLDDGLENNRLVDTETGELIVTWVKDHISYIHPDYVVVMEQNHTLVEDEHRMQLHNDYILHNGGDNI